MRLEEIRQQFKDKFVLLEVTKTGRDETEILEGNVLAHSKDRKKIMALMVQPKARHIAVEWCGEIDPKVAVVISPYPHGSQNVDILQRFLTLDLRR